MKRFYNRWSKAWQYADCGKCPECQQRKANKRTARLKNSQFPGYVDYFVTLTYRNNNIPYIRRSDLYGNKDVPIYRDYSCRRCRINGNYQMALKFKKESSPVDYIPFNQLSPYLTTEEIRKLPKLKGQGDSERISVLYYKDLQNFVKRLRINLQRRFGVSKPIYVFQCSEYGPTTFRGHFHVIVSVPKESMVECEHAICASWPYDSESRKRESCELVRSTAASYVSSYVNRSSDFPNILSVRCIRPRHSFSREVGFSNWQFALSEILSKIRKGDLRYDVVRNVNGTRVTSSFLLPKYVLDRYFIRFRGYSRLTYGEMRALLTSPESIYTSESYLIDKLGLYDTERFSFDKSIYDPDFDLIRTLIRTINLRYQRFISEFEYLADDGSTVVYGLPDNSYSRELFADYYYKVWKVYHSNIYKFQFVDKSTHQMLECYYNHEEVHNYKIKTDIYVCFSSDPSSALHKKLFDPNNFVCNVAYNQKLTDMFNKCLKRRKTTNSSMSAQGHRV